MFKTVIFLLLSQFSMAAENRKYIRVGENPVSPMLLLKGERIFRVENDTFLTTYDGDGKKHTGWLSTNYHFVGRRENNQWRAIRIYECGNPIVSPRIMLRTSSTGKPRCPLDKMDWLAWTVGPGLVGYGLGAKETVPLAVGGGVIVIDQMGKSNRKKWKCEISKKGLIGLAAAGIGYLIGDVLHKPDPQRINPGSPNSGGPGPTPPNGLAVRF